MAKPISYSKRDLEKKKQEKRAAKQQKKESKKGEGSASFEDMIAYVDENGVISDTPPVLNTQKIEAETIEISVPRKEEVDKDEPLEGRIEHFNTSKGYGFVKPLKSIEKYFFHVSGLTEEVTENNIVTFELERGPRGMNAVNIKVKR